MLSGVEALVPHLLLDEAESLREITAALAHSRFYLGASLHGYVVSTAYGVPGVLVGRPAYHKFSGFLAHTGREGDLAGSWPQAFAIAETFGPDTDPRPPAAAHEALDTHWQAIVAAFEAGAKKDPVEHEEQVRLSRAQHMAAMNSGMGI